MNTSRLLVIPLTDSFASLWPALALEAGLTLETGSSDTPAADAGDAVGILAGGGAEESLVNAAHQLAEQKLTFAAIASVEDYRLAANTLRAGADQFFVLPRDLELLKAWVAERARRAAAAAPAARLRRGPAEPVPVRGDLRQQSRPRSRAGPGRADHPARQRHRAAHR